MTHPEYSVNHPYYYRQGSYEVIDIIEEFNLGFHLGCVIKYILRAGRKPLPGVSVEQAETEDLRKAMWYLDRELQRRERLAPTNPTQHPTSHRLHNPGPGVQSET